MKKTLICLLLTILFISFAWARGPINDIEPQVMNQARIDAKLHGTTFQVNNRDEDITITVTVDSWPSEASWNLWDYTASAYYWGTDWTFSSVGEVQIQTVSLANGLYSVDCWDTYGDGGIAGIVTDSGGGTLVEWTSGAYTSFGSFDFEVGAVAVEFTVTPAAIDETVAPDANVDVPVTIANIGAIEFDYTTSLSFPIFSFDAQTPHGETGSLGAEFDGTYFWTTSRGLIAAEHQIFKWDADGNLLNAYDQGTTSAWGMRDIAWDPVSGYLYAGDDNGFYQIDPATGGVTTLFTGQTFGVIRALALLPDGTFWTKSFTGNIYIFDIAGNVIISYVSALSTYGAAYDPDNNCVWVFEGTTPNTPLTTFSQWDVATATFTGVTIHVPLLDGLTAQIIGGAFYHDGKIGGMLQGTDVDTVFEMDLISDWLAITANGTGTIPIGGSADVTVNLDATGLIVGDFKEGNLGITGVAGMSTQETDVPVTMTVEEGVEDYIEIGDGTTYGNYPSYYCDWSNYWENCHTQTLYLSSELGEAKTLTELSYNFERIATPDNWLIDVVIRILPTSDDVLTTGAFYDMTGATVVWNNAYYIPATAVGWNDLIDITDFDYNGTDNLIVDILWGDNGYYESPYYRTYRTDSGVARVLYGYADSETPPNYDGSSTEFSNIRFYYTAGGTTQNPPENLFVDETGYATWDPPAAGGDWLFYHDGTFETGLASTAGGAGIAQMFQPASYPCTIEQIEYFVNTEGVNGQEIEVWIIADDLTTVLGGPYTTTTVLDWNTVDIDDIVITSGEFLVATYNVLASGPYIGCDDSTYNGTLYFGDHITGFTELGVYGYYMVGSHGAFVTYGADNNIVAKHQVLKPVAYPVDKSYNSDIAVNNTYRDGTDRHTRDLLGYNVYLDGGTPPAFTTDLFYQYTGLVNGTTYLSEVTALYDEGESDPIDYTFTYVEELILTLPIFEGFEGGALPDSWTQEYVVGTVDWAFQNGGYNGNPAAAHTGSFNAFFYDTSGDATKLVTPQIDMGTATDVTLTFWHTQAVWAGDQDNLRVYYKNSAAGAWTMLAEYLGDIPAWTEEIITLPDLSGDYYVAFEGFGDYGYGVCVDDISIEGTGVTFDPPTNVFVDDESLLLTWFPPTETIIEDNFDSYTVGDYLCVVAPDLWTTWSGTPGSSEDVLISDAQAASPDNSILVELNNDIVLIMDDYTTGKYSFDLKMYVPSGFCGYYNLQKTSVPGTEWAFQIYFQTSGIALADAGGAGALTYPFNHDEWMDLKIIVDLDNDWATYYHNGEEMIGYQYSTGCFGTATLLQFGGVNIFGGANAGTTDIPMFYVDDVELSELRDIIGFNVFLDDMVTPHANVDPDVYEYQYTGLTIGQEYTAGVSAVYDEGESEIIQFVFTPQGEVIAPPENLTAEIVTFNDVLLNWEAPGGGGEVLLDQAPNQSNGIFSDASYPQVLADNFILTAETTIAQLVVWGGYYSANIPMDPDYFTVIFHDDAAGLPGATISTEVDVPYVRVQTGIQLFGVDEWMHTLTLASPVTLAAGTYWVEFYNTTGYPTTDTYFWEVGNLDTVNGIMGQAWATTAPGSGWLFDSTTDMALQLISGADGDNVASNHSSRVQEKVQVNNERMTISSMRPMMISDFSHKTNFTHRRSTNTAATDDLRVLLGYKVYQDGVEIEYIEDPGTLTYTVLGVEPGVHDYYVTAMFDGGESDPSNTGSVEIILPIPQNVVASFNYPNVLVTWDAVSDNRDIVSYNVYRDDMGTTPIGNSTSGLYVDMNVPDGTYIYNVTGIFTGGWESAWSEDSNEVIVTGTDNLLIPVRTELTGNYPNPFNPVTTIKFALNKTSDVSIKIYNIKGAVVRTLVDGEMKAAYHEVIWDSKDNTGKQVGSGVYFYKMISEGNSGDYTSAKKMILLK